MYLLRDGLGGASPTFSRGLTEHKTRAVPMFCGPRKREAHAMPALEIHDQMFEPAEVHALALRYGLAGIDVQRAEFHAQPERHRSLYVAAAVTETLRAERFGPQVS
jgi:hypothetical protein